MGPEPGANGARRGALRSMFPVAGRRGFEQPHEELPAADHVGGHCRRPLNALASAIRGEVLTKRHRFKAPDLSRSHQVPMAPLQRRDLVATQAPSVPTNRVSSYSQSAPFFSPNAEGLGVGIADLEVLRECKKAGGLRQLSLAWHGWWCDSSHHVVFRKKRPDAVWYLPLYHYTDSGVLAVEIRLDSVPSARSQPDRFVSFLIGAKPVVMAILDHTTYEVLPFTWRSWAWQVQRLGKTRACTLRLGIRAFVDEGSPSSILEAAARSAFWQLPRSTLEVLAEVEGVIVTDRKNMLELLLALIRHILQLPEDKCLSVLEQRLVAPIRSADAGASILQVDEAAACLREDDWKEITKEKKKCQDKLAETSEFRQAFRSKVSSARASGSRSRSKAVVGYKGPSMLPAPTEHVSQAVAKSLLPPRSFLWRARQSNSWNARYSQWPTRSARDTAHGGEWGALVHVLRHAWQCFLDASGLGVEHCPIADLFGVGAEAHVAAALGQPTKVAPSRA